MTILDEFEETPTPRRNERGKAPYDPVAPHYHKALARAFRAEVNAKKRPAKPVPILDGTDDPERAGTKRVKAELAQGPRAGEPVLF
jgi:hypothetical protein